MPTVQGWPVVRLSLFQVMPSNDQRWRESRVIPATGTWNKINLKVQRNKIDEIKLMN